MNSIARKRIAPEPRYDVATVVAVDASCRGELRVRTAAGETQALRAASCLVPPALADEVALIITGDGRAFIVAILVRSESGTDIDVAGDLRIRSSGMLSLASNDLSLRAKEGSVVLSKLTLVANSLVANAARVDVAAKTFTGFCDRLSQTVKQCFRTVQELDVLRAGRMDYRTEHEMSLRAENLLAGARGLAKLDAEQIHIG